MQSTQIMQMQQDEINELWRFSLNIHVSNSSHAQSSFYCHFIDFILLFCIALYDIAIFYCF